LEAPAQTNDEPDVAFGAAQSLQFPPDTKLMGGQREAREPRRSAAKLAHTLNEFGHFATPGSWRFTPHRCDREAHLRNRFLASTLHLAAGGARFPRRSDIRREYMARPLRRRPLRETYSELASSAALLEDDLPQSAP